MTFEEAASVLERTAVAFLPAGATEAHGPHLPLSTDVVIAETAARRATGLLRRRGGSSAVLPPLAYAVTEFAASFAGTLSLPFETAVALTRDVVLAATRTGFAAVVVCNAHLEPEHLRALEAGVAEAVARGARAAVPNVTRKPHAHRLGDEFKSGACHAGRYETSLVLAADPFLVRHDMLEALEDNPASLSVAIDAGKTSFQEAGGPRAYFGAPSKASAAEGERWYSELADIFAQAALDLIAAGKGAISADTAR